MRRRGLLAIATLLLLAAPARGSDGGAAPLPRGGDGGASASGGAAPGSAAPSPGSPRPRAPERAGARRGRSANTSRRPARVARPHGGARPGRPAAPRRPAALLERLTVPAVAFGPSPSVRVAVALARRSALVRLELVPAGGGAPVSAVDAGRVPSGGSVVLRWALGAVPEGAYVVRAAGRDLRRGALAAGAPLLVRYARFPVLGPHSYGGADARFGAPRRGHVHQGQDITAASGTPVVAPRAGRVLYRGNQPSGAGLHLVVHGDDGRDYVLMHLQAGSIAVDEGDRVTTGEPLAAVGSTGASSGPHLHLEIWVGGWKRAGGRPIDPLPELRRWDAYS